MMKAAGVAVWVSVDVPAVSGSLAPSSGALGEAKALVKMSHCAQVASGSVARSQTTAPPGAASTPLDQVSAEAGSRGRHIDAAHNAAGFKRERKITGQVPRVSGSGKAAAGETATKQPRP